MSMKRAPKSVPPKPETFKPEKENKKAEEAVMKKVEADTPKMDKEEEKVEEKKAGMYDPWADILFGRPAPSKSVDSKDADEMKEQTNRGFWWF
ncbi:hypothetical protein [Halalkalibacter krulwichiae]|uniref:Uncharacterized protein n=1 Tax=Halalkalibacter krulwichiae TaxID=199441 RepID=A0A1X9M802_9BACI|nr:hypothetical protein [Halalkalibacter krulwichiae]ARK29559.1 hypothetical protein BkAM31D_06615 [Halalkalibacter krulwichiae]